MSEFPEMEAVEEEEEEVFRTEQRQGQKDARTVLDSILSNKKSESLIVEAAENDGLDADRNGAAEEEVEKEKQIDEGSGENMEGAEEIGRQKMPNINQSSKTKRGVLHPINESSNADYLSAKGSQDSKVCRRDLCSRAWIT